MICEHLPTRAQGSSNDKDTRKQIFTHGIFPEVGQKQKAENKKREKSERW